MRRTLSSAETFLMKYIFPVFWIGAFGFGTLGLWLEAFHGQDGPSPPRMRWQFLIMWIAGAIFILWFACRIKRVQTDDQSLYISNYFSEVVIPLGEIADVTESRWSRPPTVTIRFRNPTAAGTRVVFIPKLKLLLWSSHPVIAELRTLCERAGGQRGISHAV
jgi:hypothetical protein